MRWPLDFGPQSLWKSQGSILRQGIAGDASRGIGTLASGLNAAARLRPPSERSQNWAKPRIMTERSLRSKWWWMARFSQTKILTLWTCEQNYLFSSQRDKVWNSDVTFTSPISKTQQNRVAVRRLGEEGCIVESKNPKNRHTTNKGQNTGK